jgi:hypothetical protein
MILSPVRNFRIEISITSLRLHFSQSFCHSKIKKYVFLKNSYQVVSCQEILVLPIDTFLPIFEKLDSARLKIFRQRFLRERRTTATQILRKCVIGFKLVALEVDGVENVAEAKPQDVGIGSGIADYIAR